uniref:Uncharacterized protein n=1 Tax=Melopsittacus undulatus TaxID=13146 RepID=A0A8V5FV31_MELUD
MLGASSPPSCSGASGSYVEALCWVPGRTAARSAPGTGAHGWQTSKQRWFPVFGNVNVSTTCNQQTAVAKSYVQACRALMIASIVLGFIAAVLSLLGLKCTKIGLSDEDGKMKFAVTGGFLFILGGLCSMVAVSWYAAMITAQFFDPLYAGTKYEIGDALYLGWAGSVLCMLGGILLTCSCKGKKNQDYSFNKYPYSAGHAAPPQDVYIKNSDTVISHKEYV